MRWFNFAIVVVIVAALQVGVCRVLGLGPQRVMPDLLLLVGIVVAMRGPSDQAMIACWVLGLMKDVSSEAALGSYALCFGLLGMLIVWMRDMLYGENPLTIIVVAAVGSFLVEQLAYVLSAIRGEAPGHYGGLTLGMFFSALVTAALAPYGQWLLLKLRHQLGLPRQKSHGR